MTQCLDTTEDAMVGQQLARLFIVLKQFDKAKEVIERSVSLQPKNSYLLDTHGQVFFSKMIHLFSQLPQESMSISDQAAAELINTAFHAIAKFKLGQEVTFEEEDGYNDSCFIMLVKTSIDLLENFHRFSCQKSEKELIEVLNNPDIGLEKTSYRKLGTMCQLEELRCGMKTQSDIESSLRMLEERQYQLKRTFYTIRTSKGEQLLLGLRERYERFYGNKTAGDDFKFNYGVGLKSIMTVYGKDLTTLEKKVETASEAIRRCETGTMKRMDNRDLLVVLGYEVVKMSLTDEKFANPLKTDDYCRFLWLAEKLLTTEKKSHRPHLEAFLYFTILNWPSESRNDVTNLCRPEALKNAIKEWDTAFQHNFRQDPGKKRHTFPKTYFAFGNRTLGCDIVDFSKVEELWRNKKNIKRYYVKNDQVLKEQFVIDVLKRFDGILNQNGTAVAYESKWGEYWEYHLDIKAYQPKRELSNRKVTFILLFTWAGPRAHDIQEYGEYKVSDDEGEETGKKKKKDTKKKGEKEEKKDEKETKVPISAQNELLKKQKEEEERLQREEDERISKEKQAIAAALEKKRLNEERKQKKKQKEKEKREKREKLKAEGKKLTSAQKADKRRAEQMLEMMRAQGFKVPSKDEAEAEKKKWPVYGQVRRRKNKEDQAPGEGGSREETPKPTKEEEKPVVEEEIEEDNVEEKREVTEEWDDGIKDEWDATSSEEEEEESEEKESTPESDRYYMF